MDFEQFSPPPKLHKNELQKSHNKSEFAKPAEMKRMEKEFKHYDEVVDPVEVMKHKEQMAQIIPEID